MIEMLNVLRVGTTASAETRVEPFSGAALERDKAVGSYVSCRSADWVGHTCLSYHISLISSLVSGQQAKLNSYIIHHFVFT